MAAISALAKANGLYPQWKAVIEKHQLRWSRGDTDEFYQQYIGQMLSGEQQVGEMLQWLQQACEVLPATHSNMLCFTTLSGLRPSESCEALKLLKSEERDKYVLAKSEEITVLQHYLYPQTFFRRTKKCFVSLLSPEAMELADRIDPVTPEAIRKALAKKEIASHTKWARKTHNSMFRRSGVDSEEVDVLAGRCPKTVFAKFYLRNGLDWQKIAKANTVLYAAIAPLIKR